MPSIHRCKGSPFWYCAFYLPNGRRAFRSTGKTGRREAMTVCLRYDEAARLGRDGRLSEQRARQVIADIFASANAAKLPNPSVREHLAGWLSRKALEVSASSMSEYRTAVRHLEEFLGERATLCLDRLEARDIVAFRDDLARRVSASTVNKILKILRLPWREACKEGLLKEDAFGRVGVLKESRGKRRPFTLAELQALLAVCDADWRGMVLLGVFTGQRLGDIATLTWRQVDLVNQEVHFVTRKTGKELHLPMAGPLGAYFMARPSADDPDEPVFKRAAGSGTNTLSREFYDLMAAAGLVAARSKDRQKEKDGRGVRRTLNAISFHALRHTATSLLKNAGVSDVVAREIVGHDSAAVSRVYTHVSQDALRRAVDAMPDVTKQ